MRIKAGLEDEGKRAPLFFIQAPTHVARASFFEGEDLDNQELPPSIQATSLKEPYDSFDSIRILHCFWTSLRWKCAKNSKPTTWLELFALFRALGGGPRIFHPHEPKPIFSKALRTFIKGALFRICGSRH